MPVRTLIVDDEPLARQRIADLLASQSDFAIIGACTDGRGAVDSIRQLDPDLVFLDIQMPVLDGFGVVGEVGVDQMPAVVFVTAYDRFALQAFEVHALDYLLKPYDRERFQHALERARGQIRSEQQSDLHQRLVALLEQVRPKETPLERLVIKSGGRVCFVRVDELDWVEAAGNYLRLHAGATVHLLRETVNRLETRLDSKRFVRIHRSVIVNIDRVREVQPAFHGDSVVLLRDGTELTLSRGYKERFNEFLSQTAC